MRAARFTALLLLLVALHPAAAQTQDFGQIVLYLEKIAAPASETMLSFDLFTLQSDDAAANLISLAARVSSDELERQQILLAEADVPPILYRELSFAVLVKAAPLEGMDSALFSYRQEINIPLDLVLQAGSSQAVFLQWEQTVTADTTQPLKSAFYRVQKRLPPLTARAYVSNESSGNLSILDLQSGETVGCLRVGQGPRGMAVSRQSRLLYVANSQSHTISVLDLQTQQLRAEINLDFGDEPQALCLARDERKLFSANHGSNSVTVLDAERFVLLSRVSVGTAPLDIAADPAGDSIYVANSLSDDISVLNSRSDELAYTLTTGAYPAAIEFEKSQRVAYVANLNSGSITQINTHSMSVSGEWNLNRGVRDIVSDSFSGTLYCALENLDVVSIFKPALNIEIAQIPVGAKPQQAAFDPQSRLLYVCCAESDNLFAINRVSGRVERVIAAGQSPYMVIFP